MVGAVSVNVLTVRFGADSLTPAGAVGIVNVVESICGVAGSVGSWGIVGISKLASIVGGVAIVAAKVAAICSALPAKLFAFAVAEQMQERGFYCCTCVFPAVPMNRPGIRFTVTRHNEPVDIPAFIDALAQGVESLTHSGAQLPATQPA